MNNFPRKVKVLCSIFEITILIFIYFTFFLKNVVSAAEYIKYENNPIIKFDSQILWKRQHVAAPFVLFDEGIYKMWYGAHDGTRWRIAYATSQDGKNWSDYAYNPVLTPSSDGVENHTHTPRVIKDADNHYFMYYTASPDDSTYFEIRIAESQNGINWNKLAQTRITKTQSWEHWGLAIPMVIKDSLNYHMWYDSHDGSNWRLGYATSLDGILWSKYQNNPLSLVEGNASGSLFALKEGDKLMGWRHGGQNGPYYIFQTESNDYVNWGNKKTIIKPSDAQNSFDKKFVAYPSVVKIGTKYYLYYSGHNGSNWQIGLAIMDTANPLIIIPGFMGSWNKEAILHNQDVSVFDWKVPSFVQEYLGLTNSLKNLGYEENKDFYVFPYDWRKGVDATTTDLDTFLTQKIWVSAPDKKVDIVGHSLGGLVGRIFTQKNINKVNKLVTVGAPHKGVVQAYKPVAAGEIDRENTLMWLAEKLILILNKDSFENDHETIKQRFPVAYDLLPTFNFLKKSDGTFVDSSSLSVKNLTLINYNASFSGIYNLFNALYGQKDTDDTPAYYTIQAPNMMDKLFGNYQDGKPKQLFNSAGDAVVLSTSAKEDSDPDSQMLALDHGEIIYKDQAIKKIFDVLGITYQDQNIVGSTKTNLSPSLIFLLKSPAVMEVNYDSNVVNETDGIIFIAGAQAGDYLLKIKGKDKGRYTAIIGQVGNDDDVWTKLEGEITKDPPETQIDTYTINFNPGSIQSDSISSSNQSFLINELILYLNSINTSLGQSDLTKAINNLNISKQLFAEQNYGRLKSTFLLVQQQIFSARGKISDEQIKKNLLYALTKLEYLYGRTLSAYTPGIFTSRLKDNLKNQKNILNSSKKYLLEKKQQGNNISKNASVLSQIETKLNLAEDNLQSNKPNYAEILIKSVQEMVKEIRKI